MGEPKALAGFEDQLLLAQAIAHMGSWEWDPVTNVVRWSDELYRIYGLEPRSVTITFESFLSRVHEEDRERIQHEVGRAMERGGRFAYRERIRRPDGSIRQLDTIGEVLRNAQGHLVGLIGTCRDITEESRARKLQADEQRVLEMIASDAPLAEVLDTLIRAIEDHAPPTLGSILLIDSDGKHMRHISSPGLPAQYTEAIDGSPIGPAGGSCGTAAYERKPVFVVDIENDPLWDNYRSIARRFELRACWSTPLVNRDGRVLGTFAFYYREPRTPSDDDIRLIERASRLASIAIERRQLEDQLRALSAHVESVREDERTGIAREIHDELGQTLTALRMDLAWLGRRVGAPELDEKIRAMSQMVDGIVDQVRRISAELRPGMLDDLGLVAAIEWQCQQFQERTSITCIARCTTHVQRFERNLSTTVFRILQEALTNIARHAGAEHVEVELGCDRSALRLEVRDDGRGIPPEIVFSPKALGLLGIRERARRLGGNATIVGESGTTVTVVLPLPGGAS